MSKQVWYIKKRGSYLPSSWQGWLSYVPYVAYIVGVLVYVEVNKDSFWLAVFTTIPNWIAASAVMTWLARQRS
jgi:hypothetical protein